MGQSDREFFENANLQASLPAGAHAHEQREHDQEGPASPWSPLMLDVEKATSPENQLEAAYLALFSRKPSAEEKALWAARKPPSAEDTMHALLNTKVFLFIE